MSLSLDLQINCEAADSLPLPNHNDFTHWVTATVKDERERAELVIRLVDEREMTQLNEQFRHKAYPTNVLSFPLEATAPLAPIEEIQDYLGDIIICLPVVSREAQEQNKSFVSHLAHLSIHGTLHLLGYDHQNDAEAEIMEGRERDLMTALGFSNPYQTEINV